MLDFLLFFENLQINFQHFQFFVENFKYFQKKDDLQKSHLDDEEIFEKNVDDFFDRGNTSSIHVCKAVFNNIECLIY